MAPATPSLVFGTVQAPLGLVMLVITRFIAAIFVAYALWLQGSALLETRRMTRDLAAQRQIAGQAEASRFTEVRGRRPVCPTARIPVPAFHTAGHDCVNAQASIAIDRRQPRSRGHPSSRRDDDLAALREHQLRQVIQHVVDVGMRELIGLR